MAEYDPPADLLEAQRAYFVADAEVLRVTGGLPSSVDVVAGTATVTEEQRAALAEARSERLRIVDVLYAHEWFKSVDDQHAARMALQAAAKA